jgi:undecaprenyl-diphosphatase
MLRAVRSERIIIGLLFVLSQLSLAVLGAIAALYTFVLLADGVMEGATVRVDEAILGFFRRNNPSWFDHLVWAITFLANGSTIAVVAVGGVLVSIYKKRFWPNGAAFILASLGGWGVIELLKRIFQRSRPENVYDVVSYSFPSGHSFLAVAVYGFIAYRITRKASHGQQALVWFLCLSAIALIACSRMIIGVHYPTDVLAGVTGGTAWLWACLALPKLFEREEWQKRMAVLLARAKTLPEGVSRRERIRTLLSGLAHERSLGGVASWVLIAYARIELWLAQRHPPHRNTDSVR